MTQYSEIPPDTQTEKTCTKCGVSKPLSAFHRHKRMKYGRRNWCKECVKAYYTSPERKKKRKVYRQRPEVKEKEREYKQSEKYCAYLQRPEVVEAQRERSRKYKSTEHGRTARAEYAARTKEHKRNHDREYYQNNRARIYETSRKNTILRRSRKRGLPTDWSKGDIEYALSYFDGCCAVCGNQLNGFWHTTSWDHWIPISADIENNPGTVPHNMVPLCYGVNGCNNSKHNKMSDVWLIERYGKQKAQKITKRIEEFFKTVRKTNVS